MDSEASSGSWLIIAPLDTRCNRFSYYWPRLEELDIPLPTTELITLGKEDGETPTWNPNQIVDIMGEWGANRAFIRSDYKAAPHYLNKGSYIARPDENEINRTVTSLLTQLSAAGWNHGEVLVLREWLDLDFCMKRSHTNCHPEVRFFIEAGEVLGGTPIDIGPEGICNLQYDYLTDVLRSADSEIPRNYAHTVADHFTQKTWAVDFVMDTNGEWYCTEMGLNAVRWAEEEDRWINHCDHGELEPFGPSEMHSAALYTSSRKD